jgi:thiosulfate/3-mercaptopyruvate sulfurtransferase
VLTPDANEEFRPASELLPMYAGVGVTPDKEILTYCHGNIRSSHTAFTLALLGFDRVRNYEGAWAEWGNRLDLPLER